MPSNYIRTANPFNLATPPEWFLAQLAAYDPNFVIFPSVKHPYYCTGRRGRYMRGLMRPVPGAPDSAIYVEHKLWPWKPILPEPCHTRGWPGILMDLPMFDTQRLGADPGRELDEAEDAADFRRDQATADAADQLGKDTWGTYQLMEGARVGAGSRRHGGSNDKLGLKPSGRRRRSRRPATHGQPGGVWIGRR